MTIGAQELPPVGPIQLLDLTVRLTQEVVGDLVDEFPPLEVVMVTGDLGERLPPPGGQFGRRVGIEEAEDRESDRQIVYHRGSSEQPGSLHGEGDTPGDGVVAFHIAQVHPVFEVANQSVGVALVGTDRTEGGTRRLQTVDLAWTTGLPSSRAQRG